MVLKKIPRFEKVLFCLPLRRGVILLIYLNLLIAAAAVYTFGFLDFLKWFLRLFTTRSMGDVVHRAYRSKVHPYLIIPLLFLYSVSELGMAVFALVGLHLKRVKFIKIYLYFSVIVTAFMILFRMLDVSNFHWYIDIAAAALFLLFKLYLILSIRSLVKKMLENNKDVTDVNEDVELEVPREEERDPEMHHRDVWRPSDDEEHVDGEQLMKKEDFE